MNAKKLVLALFYSSIFHTTRRNVSVKKKMRSFEQYDGRINEIIIHKIRLTSVNDRKKKCRTKSTEKKFKFKFTNANEHNVSSTRSKDVSLD